jgi:Delta6-protoilludene synthase
MTVPYFTLPDLLEKWPFDHEQNPLDDVVRASARWLESYGIDKKAQEAVNRCKPCYYFASLAYPRAFGEPEHGHYRLACDWMHLLFAYDVLGDKATGEVGGQYAKDMMNAVR